MTIQDVKKLAEAKVGETAQVEFSKFDRLTVSEDPYMVFSTCCNRFFYFFSVAPGIKYNRILFLA